MVIGLVVSGHTLLPEASAITISSTPIGLGNSQLTIGTSIIPLPTQAASFNPNTFTVGGYTFISNHGGVIIDDQTLSPGGSGYTTAGTSISVNPSGLVNGTSTYPLPTYATSSTSSTFVIGG